MLDQKTEAGLTPEDRQDEQTALLRRIAEGEKQIEKYLRLQHAMTLVSLCCAVVLICALLAAGVVLGKKVKQTAAQADQIMDTAAAAMERMGKLTEGLDGLDVSRLKQLDLQALSDSIGELGNAAKKLSAIDINDLNDTIRGLKNSLGKFADLDLEGLSQSIEKFRSGLDSLLGLFSGR